ncbi:4Fe-4S binding protein [Adlercreutzia sp. R25]|uniref:4Fe-4S binding protein n=1 Tax=Adlercreutzia shanghongiae TaxID=3111773 RepID=A0ABU6IXE6_9ACTN|nr:MULTISPECIES: 4Fe-4S binding protein [unclassified Adlercreutzia]MEC4272605.1 4Fe-4S binding protein [Adlercreutzia sp. R25]MEC4294494.1 4Fe-4S binding protein [Adlercreutzia sp. R22]
MKIINRRAFVGTMGVAGASALVGCSPKAEPSDLSATGEQAAEAEAAAEWAETAKNPEVAPLVSEAPIIYSDAEVEEILNNPAVVTTEWVNEDGSTVSAAHQMVRNVINRNGVGTGSLINKDHQLDLWPFLFSEEEALLYSQFPYFRYFSADELTDVSGKSADECLALCNAMADRGLLRRVYEDGKPTFLSLGSEYGYYEAYVQNFTPEYIELKDLNKSDDMIFGFVDSETSMYRTLPVDLDVCIDGEYTQWDDWRDIFKRHDTFSVSPCMCRVSTLIREGKAKTTQEAMELFNAEMRDCGHPMETCICTGKNAEWQIEIGAGREITAEEAIAILENSVKEGMIIETVYTKDAENICSCHADCCLNVGGIRALNGGPAVTKNYSNFTLMHKKDECIKCGMCEKQCPMYAITMDDEGYPIVDSACVRCGQCATVCPQGVRGLKLKPEEDLPYIPQTLEEDYELKARVRISKGYLYDITSQDEMKEIADAVAQA